LLALRGHDERLDPAIVLGVTPLDDPAFFELIDDGRHVGRITSEVDREFAHRHRTVLAHDLERQELLRGHRYGRSDFFDIGLAASPNL